MCHLICPHVDQFCCWFPLRVGANFMGCVCIFPLLVVIYLKRLELSKYPEDSREYCSRRECDFKDDEQACLADCRSVFNAMWTYFTYSIAFHVAHILVDLTLLLGIYLKTPVTFLVFTYGELVIFLVDFVSLVSVVSAYGDLLYLEPTVVLNVLHALFMVYGCVVVNSFYRTMVNPVEFPEEGRGVVHVIDPTYYGPSTAASFTPVGAPPQSSSTAYYPPKGVTPQSYPSATRRAPKSIQRKRQLPR